MDRLWRRCVRLLAINKQSGSDAVEELREQQEKVSRVTNGAIGDNQHRQQVEARHQKRPKTPETSQTTTTRTSSDKRGDGVEARHGERVDVDDDDDDDAEDERENAEKQGGNKANDAAELTHRPAAQPSPASFYDCLTPMTRSRLNTLAQIGEDWLYLALLGIIMALLSLFMDSMITMFLGTRIWLSDEMGEQNLLLQYLAWCLVPVLLVTFSTGFVHLCSPTVSVWPRVVDSPSQASLSKLMLLFRLPDANAVLPTPHANLTPLVLISPRTTARPSAPEYQK